MPYPFFDCKVIDIMDESDLVKRYFIRFPDEVPFTFRAGQFVQFDLPIPGKITNRSYSIASAPSDNNVFEVVIVLNPKGMGTTYMFNNLVIGSVIQCTKAIGKFGLPEVIDSDLSFICTGAGIAPLRSMILDIFNKNIPHQNIFLVFGNRFTKDILYRTEMEKLEADHSEFKFIPVLSRENADWKGHKGYVHPVYEELFSDQRPAYFYVCGWPDMIKEARLRIAAMGYETKRIKFEQYD